MTKFKRFCLLWAIFNLLIVATACGDWVSQASSIISLLVPAIQSALAILLLFGVELAPGLADSVQKWATEAVNTLNNVVKPLLDEYKNAVDSAKPDILSKIQAAVQVTADELTNILPSIHVANPETQAKIRAVFQLVLAQLVALVNLVPVLQGKVSGHAAMKLVKAVKSDKEFKHEFNDLVDDFGQQYTI